MIKTVVCKKEGCSGNQFFIESSNNNSLVLTCRECKTQMELHVDNNEYIMLSNCSKCNNDIFKLFIDSQSQKIYVKCQKCGAPPEMVYEDEDGVQISYQQKMLQNIKVLLNEMEQRMHNLELKTNAIEKGQDILEESLAYINNYIVTEKN